ECRRLCQAGVQLESPEWPDREKGELRSVCCRSGAGAGTEERKGKRTTTYCGPAQWHTAIIASTFPVNAPGGIPLVSHQTILVLDFGSQYTQLIARRLRELSAYSEIVPHDTPVDVIRSRRPLGVILSGGPKTVSDRGAPRCD